MISGKREQNIRRDRIEQVTKKLRTLLKTKDPVSLTFLINFWALDFSISKRTCKEYVELAVFKCKAKIEKGYIIK